MCADKTHGSWRETMKHLIDNLGRFISEGRAKKVRKRRTRKRASDADKMLAKQIGAAMRARVSEIPRMLPRPWDITEALALDKQVLDKFGEAIMESQLEAKYGYPIGIGDGMIEPDYEAGQRGKPMNTTVDLASADFAISCYPYGDGEGVVCSVMVDRFDPEARDDGVMMSPEPPKDGINIEAQWERKKKPFDPSKNLWPLIKTVMKELKKQMPDYEEFDPEFGGSDTERFFGSESAYWKWKEG